MKVMFCKTTIDVLSLSLSEVTKYCLQCTKYRFSSLGLESSLAIAGCCALTFNNYFSKSVGAMALCIPPVIEVYSGMFSPLHWYLRI